MKANLKSFFLGIFITMSLVSFSQDPTDWTKIKLDPIKEKKFAVPNKTPPNALLKSKFLKSFGLISIIIRPETNAPKNSNVDNFSSDQKA
jgi:hypothetical protein